MATEGLQVGALALSWASVLQNILGLILPLRAEVLRR